MPNVMVALPSIGETDRQTNRHYENNGHLAVNQIEETTGQKYNGLPYYIGRP